MTLRAELNKSDPNRTPDVGREVQMGELMTLLIAGLTPTETGVVPSSDVATLAAQPNAMFQIDATAGTVTGIKKLLKGPITGEDAVVPKTGEAVWDGGLQVLFNAADAVTAASFTYSVDGDTASVLLRDLGETNP